MIFPLANNDSGWRTSACDVTLLIYTKQMQGLSSGEKVDQRKCRFGVPNETFQKHVTNQHHRLNLN